MSGGVPYLGSKISLVSKSEIRYEGILYTIDTKESTVALAKVRSFGTEGRPTDRPVAPRDEIYEYIIFRASDIKDLHVSEPPKPQPTLTSGLPNDPAIVQHSAPVSAYSIPYGQASYGHVCSLPPFQHYPGQQSIPHMPQSFFTAGHLPGSRSATPAPLSQRKSPTSDAGVQVSGGISSDDEKSSRSRPSSPEQLKSKIRDRERDRETNQSGSAMAQQQRRQQPMRRQPQRGRGGPRRGRGRGRGLAASRTQEILKFDVEYDFEQANAEFQELEIKLAKTKLDDSGTETLAGGDTEDEAIGCYDREKSFFDNISCDASRSKSMPRFDWRIERKLNVETFGVSLSNAWRRRRGRGGFRRGFRSRGNANRVVDTQKTVTFDTVEKVVTVEATADLPSDNAKVEIPTIELIVPKESDWEGSDTAKELWN